MSILNRQLAALPRLREDSWLNRSISGFGMCVAGTLLMAGIAATGVVPGPESGRSPQARGAGTGALAVLLNTLVGGDVEPEDKTPALPWPPTREIAAETVTIAAIRPAAADVFNAQDQYDQAKSQFPRVFRLAPTSNVLEMPCQLFGDDSRPAPCDHRPERLLPIS